MVCLLVAGILLLNLIQKAFDREGVLWGVIAVVYPPGTYVFCRKNWDLYRKPFMTISGLAASGLVLFLLLKLFT
jgi:hypothetical protein